MSGANCLSSVCWVPHRTLHLQFDSQVDQRPLRFRFERFSHQSLSLVNYSENSRSRLFKVIIKLLCALLQLLGYFFFLRLKKSFLSVSKSILGSGDQYLKHLFWRILQCFFCLHGCPVLFFFSFYPSVGVLAESCKCYVKFWFLRDFFFCFAFLIESLYLFFVSLINSDAVSI